MGGRALTVTEIVAATGFYDYEAKYAEGGSADTLCRPGLPAEIGRRPWQWSRRSAAHDGARVAVALTRADLRYDDVNDLIWFLLEVNTQPGMTPTSLVRRSKRLTRGSDFDELVLWITFRMGHARGRCGGNVA